MKTYKNLKYNDDFTICYGPVKDIKIPHFHKNTKIIAKEAFKDSRIVFLKFPKNLKTIEASAFENCKELLRLDFSDSIEEIKEKAFFLTPIFQKTLKLPKQLRILEYGALDYTFSINTIIIQDCLMNFKYLPPAKYKVSENNANFASYNGDIYSKDFKELHKKGKENLPIHENCKTIISGAFKYYFHDTYDIVLPKSITRIESEAFEGADINSLTLPQNFYCTIHKDAFYLMNCKQPLILPENFEKSLQDISGVLNYIKTPVKTMPNSWIMEEDGVIYSRDKSILYYYPQFKTDTEFTIPDNTFLIASNAFKNNEYLQIINISGKSKEIQSFGISNCNSLKEINFNTPVRLNEYAISYVKSLKKIDLPKNSYFNMLSLLAPIENKEYQAIDVFIDPSDYDTYIKPYEQFMPSDINVIKKDLDFLIKQGIGFKQINKLLKEKEER